ncbi:MAG: hypothetical protein C5S48_05875 [Candidatus Methanogaster sp.]|nr:MAG: hypothetical protein C5S48_05875 [ANME-2 cluster archaeon]
MNRNNTLRSITIGILLMLSIVALCTGTVSAKPRDTGYAMIDHIRF